MGVMVHGWILTFLRTPRRSCLLLPRCAGHAMPLPMSELLPLLRTVERPGRYLGGEVGLPDPPAPGAELLRVVVGFPDVYEVGMSHLGFRLLHAGLLDRGDLAVERVFLPWPDLQQKLRQQGEPLFTLERHAPFGDADLLALSVQYELAYPAVLRLLDLAHIPRRTRQRLDDGGRHPLVLVGGVAALCPEPLAPFVDAFFVGEADLSIHTMVEALIPLRGAPLRERLHALARLPGVYVPALTRVTPEPHGPGQRVEAIAPQALPVSRVWVEDLDALPVPSTQLVPATNIVHDRVTVEIQRGCCQGCRFCQAGYTTRPVRQRDGETVVTTARRQLARTGYRELALLSLSAGDHPQLQAMLGKLIQEHQGTGVAVSLPSLRTESLHPAVARQITRTRRNTFTLAPEAATDRLRRVINKRNTDDDLLDAVRAVVSAGYSRIKLYFMLGLPTETDHDIRAIGELAWRALDLARQIRRTAAITVSVSTFVPKPHTAFQWEEAPDEATILHKLGLLKATVRRPLTLRWHDPGQSVMEACLARGDRRLAEVLDLVVTPEHMGLDAWTEHFDGAHWKQTLAEARRRGLIPDPALYLAARPKDAPLPWDHIDVGVERDYLWRERRAALAESERADCVDGPCDHCGVCPEDPLHTLATRALADPGTAEPTDPRLPVACQVRVWFRKEGRAALLAHLEMASVFERAARRAGLPLAHSKGHNPRPKLRFSPALPLGAESLCEVAELGLSRVIAPEEVAARLRDTLPPGITVERGEDAPSSLVGRFEGIHWLLRPPRGITAAQAEALRRRLAGEPLEVTRKSGRTRALSDLVIDLRADAQGALEVHCLLDERGTVRPEELLRLLLELDDEAVERTRVTRVAWDERAP